MSMEYGVWSKEYGVRMEKGRGWKKN